ncbi:MAG: hypothetical protein OXD50_03015 [Chloroflexi bacterium]|nr:hypothetical protein [Chloroflexota bacterium]
MLDLREVEERQVLEEAAPPLIAEWRGEEYGVMGQSADGTAVRLLKMENETSSIIGAPTDEVTLLGDDVTLRDLPILIGDETVVFPGDDFRVGQGKILPKANEWMWLPWGWLLAHNDTHIWQWRPKTDELEFIRRPPGFAKLSPRGESLAILTCGGEESCFPYLDVTLLPLDGRPMVRLLNHAEVSQTLGRLKAIDIVSSDDFIWTSDGRGLLIPLVPEAAAFASAASLLHTERPIVTFDPRSRSSGLPGHCRPAASPRGYGWRLRSNDLVAFRVRCQGDDRELTAFYDASEQSITLDTAASVEPQVSTAALAQAETFGQLSDSAYELRGSTDRHSIVVDPAVRKLFIFDQAENHIRAINADPYLTPDWLWELLDLGPGYDYQHLNLYQSGDNHVAVIWMTNYTHVAAAYVIDLTTTAAFPLPIGAVRTWPCYPTGGWSPDGAIFQIEFESHASDRLHSRWTDGLALVRRHLYQRQFVSSEGEIVSVLRATDYRDANYPAHMARWSPNGHWLEIGGHQDRHHCW